MQLSLGQNEDRAGALIAAPTDIEAMGDLWDDWDRRVKRTGRPNRVASELTDAELIRLLAAETHGRGIERRILGEEMYQRLGRNEPPGERMRARLEEQTWPSLGPEAGP